MIHYFVSAQWTGKIYQEDSLGVDTTTHITNEVINIHPLDWLRAWRKNYPDQDPQILFWSEISEGQYEEFKEEMG